MTTNDDNNNNNNDTVIPGVPDLLFPGDGFLFVEVVLPDGSQARWARATDVDGENVIDDDTIDRLTNAIEGVLGSPDTLML